MNVCLRVWFKHDRNNSLIRDWRSNSVLLEKVERLQAAELTYSNIWYERFVRAAHAALLSNIDRFELCPLKDTFPIYFTYFCLCEINKNIWKLLFYMHASLNVNMKKYLPWSFCERHKCLGYFQKWSLFPPRPESGRLPALPSPAGSWRARKQKHKNTNHTHTHKQINVHESTQGAASVKRLKTSVGSEHKHFSPSSKQPEETG